MRKKLCWLVRMSEKDFGDLLFLLLSQTYFRSAAVSRQLLWLLRYDLSHRTTNHGLRTPTKE